MKKIKKTALKTAMVLLFSAEILVSFKTNAQQKNTEGSISATTNHVGLAVKNIDAEEKWYKKVFGMKEIQKLVLPQYKVRTVLLQSEDGLGLELIEVSGATRKREYSSALDAASDLGYGHWAVEVDDINAAYERLISLGAIKISAPAPAAQKDNLYAYVKDPEGNLIELMQLN